MSANLAATLAQPLYTRYGGLDKYETLRPVTGGIDLITRQSNDPTGIVTEEAKQIAAGSFGNSMKIPVLKDETITIGNTRSCTFQSGGPESALVTLTWQTYAFGFNMLRSQYFNNKIGYQRVFNKAYENRALALQRKLEADIINLVDTNRNIYWSPEVANFYATNGDALQVPQAEKNDYYNQFQAIWQTMEMLGSPSTLMAPKGTPLVKRLTGQGEANGVNERFQFAGYGDWYISNDVQPGLGGADGLQTVDHSLYHIAPGTIGWMDRLDPDALAKNRIHEGKYWDVWENAPIVNRDLALFYQRECQDISNVQGGAGMTDLKRSMAESWEFSFDLCTFVAWVSNPAGKVVPIIKTQILA